MVYVYKKDHSVSWKDTIENDTLSPPIHVGNYNDNYGNAVAIDGNYAVVGSIGYNRNQGIAYVYHFDGVNWLLKAKLLPSDIVIGDNFAVSVDISGDDIIVGAFLDDDNGANTGSAYVFTKPPTGWKDTTETAKLLASDGTSGDYFGYSVSISDSNIVVGAYGNDDNESISGSAYVFTKSPTGWKDTTETAKLLASDGTSYDHFGYSVSISGDNVVIGAYRNNNKGAAYVFSKPFTGWKDTTETAKLLASDSTADNYFGYSVSISDSNIVVGDYKNNEKDIYSGAAYIFQHCSFTNVEITTASCESYTSPSGKIWLTSGTYADTLVNTAGCDSIITIHLTINQPDSIIIDSTICFNSSYLFADSTSCNNIITDTSYVSFFTNINGCDSIVTENLTVLPEINISVSVSNDSIITADVTGYTYQWLDCNNNKNPITDEINQSFTASQNGNYAVEISNGYCSDTSNCITITLNGITEESIVNEINVYPNPTNDVITIKLGNLNKATIQVYDTNGKMVYSKKHFNNNIQHIALKHSGIYFVKITANNKTQSFKVVKK